MSEPVQPGVVRWTFPKDSVTFNPDGSVSVAGRAVQDDGLDVERLAEAIRRTALDHYRPEASSSYAHRVAKHYAALRTAPAA